MGNVLIAIYVAGCLGIGLCTVLFYWTVYFHPDVFRKTHGYEVQRIGFKNVVMIFGAIIGTGICIYLGAQSCFSWMPASWDRAYGSASVGDMLAIIIASNAAFIVPIGAANMADKIVKLEATVRALQH